MARWQDRKEAAKARMMYRRGVTPREEIRAGDAQMKIDNDEDRAKSDEVEKLKKHLEKESKIKNKEKKDEKRKGSVGRVKKSKGALSKSDSGSGEERKGSSGKSD